jgi:hypothetical protein
MKIEYLAKLKDNPSAYPNDKDYKSTIQPILIEEIEHLEQLYNSGNPFPKVLKELLFLAGNPIARICNLIAQIYLRNDSADLQSLPAK